MFEFTDVGQGLKIPGKMVALGLLLEHITQIHALRFGCINTSQELFMSSKYLKKCKTRDLGFLLSRSLTVQPFKNPVAAAGRNREILRLGNILGITKNYNITKYYQHIAQIIDLGVPSQIPRN